MAPAFQDVAYRLSQYLYETSGFDRITGSTGWLRTFHSPKFLIASRSLLLQKKRPQEVSSATNMARSGGPGEVIDIPRVEEQGSTPTLFPDPLLK
jgi:hypothetical protein